MMSKRSEDLILITITVIGLKLAFIIDWSWYLILLPVYFAPVVVVAGVALMSMMHAIGSFCKHFIRYSVLIINGLLGK